MHEIGTLYETVKSVEKIALENKAEKVKMISLEIGELTGMLPYFFTEYFPIVTEDNPMFKDCELVLNVVPGEALCNECHSLFNVMKCEGACPNCNSRDKKIIGGTEYIIKEIGVE